MLLTTLLCVVFLFCCLNLVGTPIAIIGVILSVVCAMSWYICISISAFYSFSLFIVIAGMLVVFSYCTALAPNPLLSSGGMFCCVGSASVFFIYVGLNEGIYLSPSLPVEMAPEFAIGFGMVIVFLGVMNLLWVLLRFILLWLYKFLSFVLKGALSFVPSYWLPM